MRIVLNPDPYWSLSQLRLANSILGKQFIVIIEARQQGKTEFLSRLLSHIVINDNRSPVRNNFFSMNTLDQCGRIIIPRFEKQLGDLRSSGLFKITNMQGAGREMVLYKPWAGHGFKSVTHFTGMGNKDAVRGGSYHFMGCDEVEQYPPNTVSDILLPMVSETGGTVILCGTVKRFGEFYNKALSYLEKSQRDKTYIFWNEDVFQAGNFSDRVIRNAYEEFCSEDNEPGFWSEYMNNPLRAATKTNPFTLKLSTLRQQANYSTLQHDQININLDRGITPGHMPYMAWQIDYDDEPMIIDYSRKDMYDMFMIPDLLVNRYGHYRKINLIFPNDILTPSMKYGKSEFDIFQSMIKKKGLTQKIALNILPKIEKDNKVVLINQAIENFNRWKFLTKQKGVGELIRDMARISFKLVEKTKFFDYKKAVENDYIHVLDMFLYACMSLDMDHASNATPQNIILKGRNINYFDGKLY